jgi:tetratricopeptide (TPR) repeat protein
MVAVGRVVLTRREHVIALEPRGRGLLGLTLRYPYEVRDEAPYFEDIPELKLPKEMLDLATHIVDTRSGHFDPSKFEDRYENALIDLLKKKEAGVKIVPAKEGGVATRLDPSFAQAWYNLSDLLDEQGRAEAAIECLRTALRVAPGHMDAMFNLALLLQRKNQYVEAAGYWRRYLAADTKSEWATRARRSLKFCEMQVHLLASA